MEFKIKEEQIDRYERERLMEEREEDKSRKIKAKCNCEE